MDSIKILEEMIKVRSWKIDPPEAGELFNREKEALEAGVEAIKVLAGVIPQRDEIGVESKRLKE